MEWRFSPESKAMAERNLASRIGLSFQQIASAVNTILNHLISARMDDLFVWCWGSLATIRKSLDIAITRFDKINGHLCQ